MEVRKLTQEEKFDARLISTFAFHFRMEDPEKEKRESETDLTEDWGAFDDDGRLMAHVMNFKFLFRQECQNYHPIFGTPDYQNIAPYIFQKG